MDTQLAKTKKFLVPGDKLTIADIACWAWVASHG
jgi:glutathione S-transferase